MKRLIILLILAQAFTFAFARESFSQETKPAPAPNAQPTEAQLVERFNKVLAEELENDDICLTFEAGLLLDKTVRRGAARITNEKAYDAVPEAEQNFRKLAKALVRLARFDYTRLGQEPPKLLKINDGQIARLILRDPAHSTRKRFCPLFPICK